MMEQIEGDEMFKAYVQLKKYAKSMDIFNRLAELERSHKIPRGELRFKEGEECQGVGCGPFVDLSGETKPRRRAYLCLGHRSIHECSDECTAGGRVCEVYAHATAQRWREVQRSLWTEHESSKAQEGRKFWFCKQTKSSSWERPPGFVDPPWCGLADTRHSKDDEPLGGLRKGSEQLRAEAHNCVASRCGSGHVRVKDCESLWICRASGLPHICTLFQCNLFHLSLTGRCTVSGNNFGASGASIDGDCRVERRLSEQDSDVKANYGIGTQGKAKTLRRPFGGAPTLTNGVINGEVGGVSAAAAAVAGAAGEGGAAAEAIGVGSLGAAEAARRKADATKSAILHARTACVRPKPAQGRRGSTSSGASASTAAATTAGAPAVHDVEGAEPGSDDEGEEEIEARLQTIASLVCRRLHFLLTPVRQSFAGALHAEQPRRCVRSLRCVRRRSRGSG